MFSDLILANSKRSRRENGLFFGALVISVIAFYIILSISNQDVMIFLREMESDAVNKLLMLIPVFYCMTLAVMFFLIFFACKYQLQRRRHEFGIYLMMGMSRGKLFLMLMVEDLVSSILALGLGLPVAVLFSEMISVVTARLVGMGIIGHQFSISVSAMVFTIAGFLMIKLVAFTVLSGEICQKEIGELLGDTPGGIRAQKPRRTYVLALIGGTVMLAAAYTAAVSGVAWRFPGAMFLTEMLVLFGTILFFYGLRIIIGALVRRGGGKLHVFNFRQIEENVIQQSTTMAISSLLVLAALCCFGVGVAISASNSKGDTHVLDYTFDIHKEMPSDEIFPAIKTTLEEEGLDGMFADLFQMRLGNVRTESIDQTVFRMDAVMESIEQLPSSDARDILLNNLSYTERPHIICLSDYNHLLELAGKPSLQVGKDEAAIYISADFTNEERTAILDSILASRPRAELMGKEIHLTESLQTTNLVTDRSITLSFALILPDDLFLEYTQGKYDVYTNGILDRETVSDVGLMQAISDMNHRLDASGLKELEVEYESYLQNIGRQLFYIVAASYITIYLAVIFLVVANTIMGVQFLMTQQKTGRRYGILVHLGADYKTLCKSARMQIRWFMGLPILVAACSSMFGIKALFYGIVARAHIVSHGDMMLTAAAMILLLVVVEWCYLMAVRRSSDRYLTTLLEPSRQE